jgi:hypothetical protein
MNDQKDEEDYRVEVTHESQRANDGQRGKVIRHYDRAEDVRNLDHNAKAKKVQTEKVQLP